MPTVKSRLVTYAVDEEDAARRLGTAAALLWTILPEVARVMLVEQAMMIEPSSPAEEAQRAAMNAFISEKSAEGNA